MRKLRTMQSYQVTLYMSCGRRGKKLFICVSTCTLPIQLFQLPGLLHKTDLVLHAKVLVPSSQCCPYQPLLCNPLRPDPFFCTLLTFGFINYGSCVHYSSVHSVLLVC